MASRPRVTRRGFLQAAAASFATPMIVSGSALGLSGAVPASERITMALIGCGGHGAGWNLDQVFRCDDAQVVAVCDVDARRLESARNRVQAHYSQKYGAAAYRGCTAAGDFRDVLRRDDVDAIINATPDHWHVYPSIAAAVAGKDVICEKPLTLFLREGRVLADVMRDRGRIFQTASENRSIDTYIHCVEVVRSGRIGKLQHMEVSLPGGNEDRGSNFTNRDEQPVPDYFNYDFWLGQAPLAPYVPARCHGSFRWNLDYSGGRMTDWGAHMMDLAQWGNNSEQSGPVEVEGRGVWPPRDALFNTAEQFELDYRYGNGVTMKVVSRGPGIRFEGSDGWIGFSGWRGPLRASDPALLEVEIPPEERLYRPSEIVPRQAGHWGGEHRNFLDCVKSRKPTYAPAEVGHRTISIAHIGNIAMLLERKLQWDPQREEFVGDDEANAMLTRPQREPWTLENALKGV